MHCLTIMHHTHQKRCLSKPFHFHFAEESHNFFHYPFKSTWIFRANWSGPHEENRRGTRDRLKKTVTFSEGRGGRRIFLVRVGCATRVPCRPASASTDPAALRSPSVAPAPPPAPGVASAASHAGPPARPFADRPVIPTHGIKIHLKPMTINTNKNLT